MATEAERAAENARRIALERSLPDQLADLRWSGRVLRVLEEMRERQERAERNE